MHIALKTSNSVYMFIIFSSFKRRRSGHIEKHLHTFALFAVESDLDNVRSGVTRRERHTERSLVNRTHRVRHGAVIHCDLQLALTGPTHVHCTNNVNQSINHETTNNVTSGLRA